MTTQAQKSEETAGISQPANTLTPLDQTPDKFTIRRPARVRLSTEETRARMEAFTTEREEAFVAAVREEAKKPGREFHCKLAARPFIVSRQMRPTFVRP